MKKSALRTGTAIAASATRPPIINSCTYQRRQRRVTVDMARPPPQNNIRTMLISSASNPMSGSCQAAACAGRDQPENQLFMMSGKGKRIENLSRGLRCHMPHFHTVKTEMIGPP